nr:unnamed protein product [Digitaria exilis]
MAAAATTAGKKTAVVERVVFALNGRRYEVAGADPSTRLLEFIRTQTPFKGTKLGCGEGYKDEDLYNKYIDIGGIPELSNIVKIESGFEIGASTTISRTIEILKQECESVSSPNGNTLVLSNLHLAFGAYGTEHAIRAKKVEKFLTGEAVYVDDIPAPKNCLYGEFIYSTKPFAYVKSIKFKSSLASEKIINVVSAKDIPSGGENIGSSFIFGDEQLFGYPIAEYAGQALGIVIAETQRYAVMAAKQVIVEYDTEGLSPPILTVEQAVENSSYFSVPSEYYPNEVGDVSKGMAEADHKIPAAEVKFASEYYFYMEPQTALAIPDEDNTLIVYSSSQYPEFAQSVIARCLGIPFSNASEENVNLSASAYWVPGQDSNKYLNYGAGISEVEIDLLTGAITLLRGDLVYDCGKSLNPAVDLGQIEGSFIQGIGFFIYEEYITNSDGLMISNSTWDYKIPSVDIIPKQFNAEVLNTGYHKNRVLSSKASGEPALVLASSVHCALREAIKAARKEFSNSGSGRSPLEFQMDVPAPMTLVKELCGFDIVENYLETLSTYELADGA